MEIITGYTGKPHVTSEQDRDVNIGVVGEGSYVLRTGMQLAAEVSSNNEIKIRDGVLMHQGCTASIKKNTYDSLTITNGSQGMKRVDLIVARYEKNQDNGIESLDLKVIQGTPAESNPTVPEYTEGDVQAGDYVADMPMYQVIIDGLNITEVKKVFEVAPGIDAMKKEIAELNSKSVIVKSGITWVVERHGNYFEAYGVYSGYVSANKLYAIDVQLPFVVDELIVAFANPSYHAYYLNKWYINEVQTYSKSKLNLCFQTVNISSKTDFKFDLFIAGSYNFAQA